jgi:four helix bundle protein
VVEEADETIYWLQIIHEASLLPFDELNSELQEANELTKIFASSRKTAKSNLDK